MAYFKAESWYFTHSSPTYFRKKQISHGWCHYSRFSPKMVLKVFWTKATEGFKGHKQDYKLYPEIFRAANVVLQYCYYISHCILYQLKCLSYPQEHPQVKCAIVIHLKSNKDVYIEYIK